MSHRLALLARVLGSVGLLGGLYFVAASWALAVPAYAVTRTVVPRMVFSEPLIWIGLALLLVPTLARFMTEGVAEHPAASPARHDPCESAAFLQCPECEQLVHVNRESCPYCGERLRSPSLRLSRPKSV